MSTVCTTSKVRKVRTVKPATGSCRLTLTINDVDYTLLQLRPHPEVARVAFALRKLDGTVYDVALTEHGPECTCPDYVYNRAGKDPKGCKHIAALRCWGLLPDMPSTRHSSTPEAYEVAALPAGE